MSKAIQYFKLRKEKKQFQTYIAVGVDFEEQRAITNQSKQTYHINLDASLDIMVLTRGIIAGTIAISISPSNFLTWAALLNGVLGGGWYILASKLFHIFEYDDTTHITQVHGCIAFWSLISICLFHKDEGFFFKDMSGVFATNDIRKQREGIMKIVGANSLSMLSVFFTLLLFLWPLNSLVLSKFSRASKV